MKEDTMIPLSFEQLLKRLVHEYKNSKTFCQVPVYENKKNIPFGVAAGPHTQMAQNIIACFAVGAGVVELKTVQVIDGENLKLNKPCIYAGHEVFNTEWSTELTVEQAAAEYIKAYILIQVLGKEFGIKSAEKILFVPSVGYDLKGIKSSKVDGFINSMKNFNSTEEWKNDFDFLKKNLSLFNELKLKDITELETKKSGCTDFALSTMHGCPGGEIESIAEYLLTKKEVNTFVKMNPTLSGFDEVKRILDSNGYSLKVPQKVYDENIDLTQAVEIINHCRKTAEKKGLKFGVKMTNTLPVYIENNELAGDTMYMSGPGLYELSLNATKLLASNCENPESLLISFSGGADRSNICGLFESGIKSVTCCSVLLKSGGYKNLSKILGVLEQNYNPGEKINSEVLEKLIGEAEKNSSYAKKIERKLNPLPDYSDVCAKCNNCVDVCPNRANILIVKDGNKSVLNLHQLCNECGACVKLCPMGHQPYLEKKRVNLETIANEF